MIDPELLADIQRWICYAKEDLEVAEIMLQDDKHPRHACLLAQQSAEKAIKAALFATDTEPPKTHDLERLVTLLPGDSVVKRHRPGLATLSDWAVEARYPGDWPEPTAVDAQNAVYIARDTWKSVCEDIRKLGIQLSNDA